MAAAPTAAAAAVVAVAETVKAAEATADATGDRRDTASLLRLLLLPSVSSPLVSQLRVHRVKAIGGRRHRARIAA